VDTIVKEFLVLERKKLLE